MPGTEKNSIQRLKILYLYKIMLEQTDELHPITVRTFEFSKRCLENCRLYNKY